MTVTSFVSTPVLAVAGTTNTEAARNLLALTVEETTVGMCWCEARLDNYGFRNDAAGYLYLGRDVLDFGTTFAVTFGPKDSSRRIFQGRISAIQADYPAAEQAQVLVFAEDALQDLRLTRRTRTFNDSSTADVANQLASEHGLTPSIDLDGPTRRVSAQLNQSDLAFLRSLARCDVGAKDAIAETADSSALGAELASGDTSGSDILSKAFGDRTEHIVRGTPVTSDEARAIARAAYLERARRFVCGTGITGGTPALKVGCRVTLNGLGALFNGAYYVSRTRHMFDLTLGYRTEFDVERAGIGAAS